MNKGGYQILDLNGIEFVDSEKYVIDGIFNKISETRKPILITNFVLDGPNKIKMRDVFAMFTLETDEQSHEKYYITYIDLPLVEGINNPGTILVEQSDKVIISFY